MTQFIGGPYDGMEAELPTGVVKRIRLPAIAKYEALFSPQLASEEHEAEGEVCVYELDESESPPKYRYSHVG